MTEGVASIGALLGSLSSRQARPPHSRCVAIVDSFVSWDTPCSRVNLVRLDLAGGHGVATPCKMAPAARCTAPVAELVLACHRSSMLRRAQAAAGIRRGQRPRGPQCSVAPVGQAAARRPQSLRGGFCRGVV
jgi:hypothetical protein